MAFLFEVFDFSPYDHLKRVSLESKNKYQLQSKRIYYKLSEIVLWLWIFVYWEFARIVSPCSPKIFCCFEDNAVIPNIRFRNYEGEELWCKSVSDCILSWLSLQWGPRSNTLGTCFEVFWLPFPNCKAISQRFKRLLLLTWFFASCSLFLQGTWPHWRTLG